MQRADALDECRLVAIAIGLEEQRPADHTAAAGAEASLALASVAADSLSSMVPGLFGGEQAQMLVQSQRERLMQQIEGDIDNTLLYVYRDLSDPELDEFVSFAQSAGGKAYYQAALAAAQNTHPNPYPNPYPNPLN